MITAAEFHGNKPVSIEERREQNQRHQYYASLSARAYRVRDAIFERLNRNRTWGIVYGDAFEYANYVGAKWARARGIFYQGV